MLLCIIPLKIMKCAFRQDVSWKHAWQLSFYASAGRSSNIIEEISWNVPLVIGIQSEEIYNLYRYLFTLNLFVCVGPKWKSFAKGSFSTRKPEVYPYVAHTLLHLTLQVVLIGFPTVCKMYVILHSCSRCTISCLHYRK